MQPSRFRLMTHVAAVRNLREGQGFVLSQQVEMGLTQTMHNNGVCRQKSGCLVRAACRSIDCRAVRKAQSPAGEARHTHAFASSGSQLHDTHLKMDESSAAWHFMSTSVGWTYESPVSQKPKLTIQVVQAGLCTEKLAPASPYRLFTVPLALDVSKIKPCMQ